MCKVKKEGKIKMEGFVSPVYNVKRVPIDKIQANSYNPNHVAKPEMDLLYKSILEDGYKFVAKNPHACVWDEIHISLDKYLEK